MFLFKPNSHEYIASKTINNSFSDLQFRLQVGIENMDYVKTASVYFQTNSSENLITEVFVTLDLANDNKITLSERNAIENLIKNALGDKQAQTIIITFNIN